MQRTSKKQHQAPQDASSEEPKNSELAMRLFLVRRDGEIHVLLAENVHVSLV
jgi:hypothetical protein